MMFHRITGTVPNAEYVADYISDLIKTLNIKPKRVVVIPVLPLSMIARLVDIARKHGWEVWWAEMEQVKILDYEPETMKDYDPRYETVVVARGAHEKTTYKIMRFKQFHRVKAIKLELEPLGR